MLQLSKALHERPVLSLRTGGVVATTSGLIVNPNNLKIEGLYCADRFSKEQLVLLTQDIRDMINEGLVINDHDVLTDAAELVRLQDVIKIGFEPLGKAVVTESKQKIGKVADFAFEDSTLYIQKLYVGQSLLKSFSGGQLSVDRNQIVEITDKKIIVKDILQPTKAAVPAAAPLAS